MKQWKRLFTGALVTALLLGLLPGGASAAAGKSAFHDISDPNVAEAAEILRLLGIVDGAGAGTFNPGGALTRAEFCKLAVEALGKGDQEPAQRSRTIFLDVGPSHWARGYINLATSIPLGASDSGSGDGKEKPASADRLIMGVGNGNFEPDRPITFGEAVAILVRILGYNNGDVSTGTHWYDGYLGIALASGLLEGLDISGDSNLSRGQAALLFKNLLFTKVKGGAKDEDKYLVSKLQGSIKESAIILAVDAPTGTDTTALVKTPGATYKTDRTTFPTLTTGARGKLVLDKDGKVLGILPDENDTIRRVSLSGQALANKLPTTGGEDISITEDVPVYKSGSTEAATYKDVWTNLYSGTPLILCYGGDGKLAYLYMSSASAASETVMVARTKPNGTANPFAGLAKGDRDYQIYKNGVPATAADLRQYDVATYDKNAKIIYVSDLRITGRYDNASPNPSAPSRVTMLGVDFKVLPGAVGDLSAFKPGKNVTLLLTSNGEVAGALDPSVAKANVVGVVTEASANSAKVEPLSRFYDADGKQVIFTGNPGLSEKSAGEMAGQLVTVTSSQAGQISLHRLSSMGSYGNLDVVNRTLGNAKLAENVAMFERVGTSAPGRVTFDQLTRASVPAARILYVGRDSTGKVNTIIFDDVTGDQYTYGFARYTSPQYTTGEDGGKERTGNATISVLNKESGAKLGALVCGDNFSYNAPIGIAASMDTMDGRHKLAGSVSLTAANGVKRASFDVDAKTVTVGDQVFPLSAQVECYNRATGYWFDSGIEGVKAARAYADTLTVYYDKAPLDGGKIRMVVVD